MNRDPKPRMQMRRRYKTSMKRGYMLFLKVKKFMFVQMLQTKNMTANLACVAIATVSMLHQDHHVKENQMMMTHHAITNVTQPGIGFDNKFFTTKYMTQIVKRKISWTSHCSECNIKFVTRGRNGRII